MIVRSSTGDSWLATFLPKILSSSAYTSGSTAIFITWDEDDSSASNHVATLVIAPSVAVGTIVVTSLNHYSMLRTTEELLGLSTISATPRPRQACAIHSISRPAAFRLQYSRDRLAQSRVPGTRRRHDFARLLPSEARPRPQSGLGQSSG